MHGPSGWTNLRTKEAKNMKNYGPKDEENSPKICHPNLHSLPCKPHRIPFGFHAMLDHSCPLHNFWFHASIHLIITLNCLIPLVPFTHKILYNFHNHNMHQLMLHHSHLESHALCTTCCCTFDPFIDTFSPPFPSLCNVHNHSCPLATRPLHFTLHTLHHHFIFTLGPLHTTHTNCHAFHP